MNANRRRTMTRRGFVAACGAIAAMTTWRRAQADGSGPAISRGEWGKPDPGRPVTLFVGRVERLIRLYFTPTSAPELFLMSHVFRVRVERVLAGNVASVVDVLVRDNSEATSISIPNQTVEPENRYLFVLNLLESGEPFMLDGAVVVSAGYSTARLTRRTEPLRLAEAEAYAAAAQALPDATPAPGR